MKKVKYDRKATCDFCGIKQKVRITKYGTTNYNRLICHECEAKISKLEGRDIIE